MTTKRVTGNFSKPPAHAKLCLRDGGQPLPSGGNNLLAYNTPMIQRPEGPSYGEQARQGMVDSLAPAMDRMGPYIDKGVQLAERYPLVDQAAQLALKPLNVAVGVGGIAQAINDRDLGAGLASTVGMTPVVGKFAKGAVLAGTKRSISQLRAVQSMGMSPSADMAATAARRVGGDAGVAVQAYQTGQAAKKQTTQILRGDAPGPFYGGN